MAWFFGKKQKEEPELVEPPLQFVRPGAPIPQLNPYLYVHARMIVLNALMARADVVRVTFTGQKAQIQYQIDGVYHNREVLDGQTGGGVVAIYKIFAGFDLKQRVPFQEGEFEVHHLNNRIPCRVEDQLVKGAELISLHLDTGKPKPHKITEMGLSEDQAEQLKNLMEDPGVVLVTAPPHLGYSTVFNGVVRVIDRYMRDVVMVQSVKDREEEVENAAPTTFDPDKGETPATVIPELLLRYPNVVCVRKIADKETMSLLLEQPEKERLVVMGLLARDDTEALYRAMALCEDPKQLLRHLKVVVGHRVLRRLCELCKTPYPPPPQLLQQLGIPQGKIKAFFKPGPPRLPPEEIERMQKEGIPIICPQCQGIGYLGQTGLFELLVLNDQIRSLFLKPTQDLDAVRQALRKLGHRTPLDEGILLAAKGITSIQEVSRVLKV